MAGQNIWDTLSSKVRGGPMSFSMFGIAVVAFVIGFSLSLEDWMSSYEGLLFLEQAFGVRTVSWEWMRLVMAITPWVGQIVFLGLWSLDTSRKWALAAAILWFVLDFISDVQFRSDAMLFPLDGSGMKLNRTVLVSALLTFIYFTIGAELFITASSAMVVTLFPDAIKEFAKLRASITVAFRDAEKILRDAGKPGGGGNSGGGGQSNNRHNNRNQQQQRQRDVPQGQPRRDNGTPNLAQLLNDLDE